VRGAEVRRRALRNGSGSSQYERVGASGQGLDACQAGGPDDRIFRRLAEGSDVKRYLCEPRRRAFSPGGDDRMPARAASDDAGDDRGSPENDDKCGHDLPCPWRASPLRSASVIGAEGRPGQQKPRQRAGALFAELRLGAILVLAPGTLQYGLPTAGH